MASWRVIPATEAHIPVIAANMREADKVEIWLAAASDPESALRNGLARSSQCYTCLVNGRPAFMFGVCPQSLLGRTATVWMLGTDDIYKIKFGRREIRAMAKYVAKLAQGFDVIENWVWDENKTSIRWLKYLGFTVEEPEEAGVYQAPFRHFEMRIH